MAIAYVKDSGELFADGASSIAPSLSSVAAGNNVVMLVASAANNTQDNFSPPSGWTDAVSPAGASGNTWNSAIAIFYKENSSGGTESGTVTLASGSYAAATICEVSGVLTTASLDTTDSSIVSTQVDTSGTTGSGVTNSQAASIVFAGLTASTGGSTSGLSRSTSGYTTIYSEAADSTHIAYSFDYQIVSSSASRSVTYTWTGGSNHSGVLAIFKEGGSKPAFTAQPEDQAAASGGTATFNCTTTGATSYQWQSAPITSLYSDCPGTWSDIGSATTEDYTTPTLASTDNGKWYRLKATNASGDTYSEAVRVWIRGLESTGKGRWLGSAWAFKQNKTVSRGFQWLRTLLAPENISGSAGATVFSNWWFESSFINTTVTPGVGHLLFTGYSPTVTRTDNITISPTTGHTVFTGYSPTVIQSTVVTPGTGHVVFTGYQATVSRTEHQTVTANTGHAVLTSYVPLVSRTEHQTVTTGVGHLSYTGYQPTVIQSINTVVTPSTGHIAYTGYVSTVTRTDHVVVTPSTGHQLYTGGIPTVVQSTTITPDTGHLTYTGSTPVVTSTDHRTITAGTGHLVLTGFVPIVQQGNNTTVTPSTGHAVFGGYSPTVSQTAHHLVEPSSGHIVLTGSIPTVTVSDHHTVTPSTDHLVFTGYTPTVSTGGIVWPLESDVLFGVSYGPTGIEYTGTLKIDTIRIDVDTGDLYKPIGSKLLLRL